MSTLVSLEALKLAAGITLLSPFIPLLFMGEEYGEISPFQYFVSHGDPDLVEAVRRGRLEEFSSFGWIEEVPDPQSESSFAASRLDHSRKDHEPQRTLLHFYKYLIQFRNDNSLGQRDEWEIQECGDRALLLLPGSGRRPLALIFHFCDAPRTINVALPRGHWNLRLHSSDTAWLGPGSSFPKTLRSTGAMGLTLQAWSFALLERVPEE